MSTTMSTATTDSDRPVRQPAVPVIASELADATHVFKTEDTERAPNFTLLPTGTPVNRVFVAGVLTQVNELSDTFVKARVYDGNTDDRPNKFHLSAGQYSPDQAATLREMSDDTPQYVAVVGKPDHWETQEGEHRVDISPESVSPITESQRNQWALHAVRSLRDRVDAFNDDNEYPQMAIQQYGTSDLDQYLNDAVSLLEELSNN